jgi:restriction system protein
MDINNNFSRFEPFEFERLIARLFEKKGYKTTVTQERGDLGVDVLAEAGSEKIAIQVKHWQAPVGGPDIHKTLGSMISYGADRAMVVTSSDFTSQAYEIQKRGAPIELWNGSRLRDEFRQYILDAIKEAKKSG